MSSRYSNEPNCGECGRKKSPSQLNRRLCTTCQRAAAKARSQKQHDSHIGQHYGITPKDYIDLRNYQAGKCAICCRATGRSKRLAVDHNHKCKVGHDPKYGCPECVRGLLCSTCNKFIGWMRDDPRVGDRMARYLRDPPFQRLRGDESAVSASDGEAGRSPLRVSV